VLALVTRQPALFGAALPFSAGWTTLQVAPNAGPLTRVFLAAGELEPSMLQATRHHYESLREAGAEAVLESYVSGHDQAMWQVALAHYMPRVFPPTKTNAGTGTF
jgi:enterochelin esterase-like enzyme